MAAKGRSISPLDGKHGAIFRKQEIRPLPLGTAYVAKGSAFACKPTSFAGYVRRVARQYSLRATVTIIDGHVVYTYYRPKALAVPRLRQYPVVLDMLEGK